MGQILYLTIIKILLLVILEIDCRQLEVHPELDLNFAQRVRRHGYPIEVHEVTTTDDYFICLYRIPHGLSDDKKSNRKNIVLIVHGMGGSPLNFIVLGRKKGSAYHFADRGLDVWLFSSRGLDSPFKRYHKTLDREKDDKFWLHSFHEIGKYDLSATIDYILNYTAQEKLTLIGHSAAGPAFFCLFSEKPEYNNKVRLVINWASTPVIKNMDYPLILLLIQMSDIIKGLISMTDMAEFLPFARSLKPTIRQLCSDSEFQVLCTKISWIIGSHKSLMQLPNDIQVIASNIQRLASRQLIHFMDNVKNGEFRNFDYGAKLNREYYGQKHPPKYNLSAATIPVAFFIGPNDGAIVREDIFESMEELPNTIHYSEVPYKKFTHLDFLFGQNASELLYEPTFKLIEDVNNGLVFPALNVSLLRNSR